MRSRIAGSLRNLVTKLRLWKDHTRWSNCAETNRNLPSLQTRFASHLGSATALLLLPLLMGMTPFKLTVVDSATGRGVPLVELKIRQ